MVLALKCTGGYWFIKVTLTEQEEDRGTKLIAAKEEILFYTETLVHSHCVFRGSVLLIRRRRHTAAILRDYERVTNRKWYNNGQPCRCQCLYFSVWCAVKELIVCSVGKNLCILSLFSRPVLPRRDCTVTASVMHSSNSYKDKKFDTDVLCVRIHIQFWIIFNMYTFKNI